MAARSLVARQFPGTGNRGQGGNDSSVLFFFFWDGNLQCAVSGDADDWDWRQDLVRAKLMIFAVEPTSSRKSESCDRQDPGDARKQTPAHPQPQPRMGLMEPSVGQLATLDLMWTGSRKPGCREISIEPRGARMRLCCGMRRVCTVHSTWGKAQTSVCGRRFFKSVMRSTIDRSIDLQRTASASLV